MNLLSAGNYTMLWLLLWTSSLLASVLALLSEKLNGKLMKIKIKHMIFSIVAVLVIMVVIIIIGLQQTEPLVMFNTATSEKEITKEFYQMQGNTNYTFTFDLEAQSKYQNTDIFKITFAVMFAEQF